MSKSCGPLPLQRKWIDRELKGLKSSSRCGRKCRSQIQMSQLHIRAYDSVTKKKGTKGCGEAAAELLNAATSLGQATELWKQGK